MAPWSATMRPSPALLILALLALAAHPASSTDGLTVTASPDADGKTLLSARAPAGAPPLPPGTVTFALASGGGTAAGDVHLGLAQATLVLPCGGSAVVDAAYVPAAAAGGEGRTGKTTAFSKEC